MVPPFFTSETDNFLSHRPTPSPWHSHPRFWWFIQLIVNSVNSERCRPGHYQYTEIRPRSYEHPPRRPTLAGHPQRVIFKLCMTVYKMSPRLGTAVPRRAVCSCCGCRHAPSTSFCQSWSAKSLQHDKLRPTWILVRWSLCLELTSWKCATITISSDIQALSKDIFVPAESHSAR